MSSDNFIRLFKMVCETSRSVMWELLLQLVESPGTIIENARKISQKHLKGSKDSDMRSVTKLLEFWEDINTTIPIEADFDITSICIILNFELRKNVKSQNNKESIEKTIKLLREKRNDLAHRRCLSISDEEYENSYIEIREHVDLLENAVNNNYKPDVKCKWIRRSSSKYLNNIDRINKECFNSDTRKELQSLINKWKNDILMLKSKNAEQSTAEEIKRSTEVIEDFAKDTKAELEDSGPKDIYDKNGAMDTLSKMKDIFVLTDENKKDMKEHVERHDRVTKRQQDKIKVLEESIEKIEKKNKFKGSKEETKADHDLCYRENLLDETDAYSHILEESNNELIEREIQEVKESTDLRIQKCKRRYREEMESHKNEFDELLIYEKVHKDLKLKQLEETFKSEIELISMSGGVGIRTREEITKRFEKEKETIERQYSDSIATLDKELKEKNSNSQETFLNEKKAALLERESLIEKIKQKTNEGHF